MAKLGSQSLVLLAGGAALLAMSSKQKKRKKKSKSKDEDEVEMDDEIWVEPGVVEEEKIKINAECNEFAKQIDFGKHNHWITNRYHDYAREGIDDPAMIAQGLLAEQSEHCPWTEPDKWTPFMKAIHEQLASAVEEYIESTGGKIPE